MMNTLTSLLAVLTLTLTLTLSLVAAVQTVQAAEVTLRFAHFWPAQSAMGKHWQAWADAVEGDSNGRIRVEVYPSQTLVKAPKTYDAVISGIADAGVTVQGYTANRFPLTQVIELPGLSLSGSHGSCVVQTLLDQGDLAGEYEETHPLFLFTHGPGMIHTQGKGVRVPADLQGLRIRRSSAVLAELLSSAGSQPVGMPAPQIYQSMSRGVIDGTTLPWEGMRAFRLNELADHHTELNLYTLSFVVTMNKRVYDGLPADLRQVIDRNAGLEWATQSGRRMDEEDAVGLAQAKAQQHTFITIEGGVNNPQWKGLLDQATDNYLAQVGEDARDLYDRVQSVSPTCIN